MVKDAREERGRRQEAREAIDARNRLDSMTYEVEKNVKDWGDKVHSRHQGEDRCAIETCAQGASVATT